MNAIIVPVCAPVYTNTQLYTDFCHIQTNGLYRTDAAYMKGQANDGEELFQLCLLEGGVKQIT